MITLAQKFGTALKQVFCVATFIAQCYSPIYGQESKSTDIDELFRQARNMAFEKKYDESQKLLEQIIVLEPGYLDLRVFYARTFAWQNQFDIARKEINEVLTVDPGHKEGQEVSIDIELWSQHFDAALTLVDGALNEHPNDEALLLRKARILNSLGQTDESLSELVKLLSQNPGNAEAAALMNAIKGGRLRNSVALFYGLDAFSQSFDPAHYSSIQFGRITNWGSALVRLNQSYRFEQNGLQPEVDFYPRITNNIYLYTNYAYSSSILFPKHRAGLEANFKIPRNFETSAGLKLLYFEASKVFIYTGSAGLYFGNYWISWRPYVIQAGSTTTFSSSITLRKYFSDADNYIGLFAAAGFSPDDSRIQSSTGFSQDGIFRLGSQRGGLVGQKSLTHNWSFNFGVYLVHQELSFDLGNYLWISSGTLSLKKKF